MNISSGTAIEQRPMGRNGENRPRAESRTDRWADRSITEWMDGQKTTVDVAVCAATRTDEQTTSELDPHFFAALSARMMIDVIAHHPPPFVLCAI